MKKFLTITLASVLLLAGGSVAYANICAFDPVPAATLLFPFVAYNYDQGADGVNTLFAITNVSSDAQIVHVTLWTDYSIPVLDWNVLLTGYDVYTFDIRSILKDGKIPATFTVTHSADGDGNFEGVLDQGPVSHTNPLIDPNWDGPDDHAGDPVNDSGLWWPESTYVFDNAAMGGCDPDDEAYPGKFATLEIDDTILLFFQQMLQASQYVNHGYNNCAGGADFPLLQANWWDNRDEFDDTWAYITADVVNTCNKAFPDTSEYWSDYAEYQNVLIGDVIWSNYNNNYSEVSNAVHIEASENLYNVTTPGPNNMGEPISFYARYSQAFNEVDLREPLPTAWAFRYINRVDEDALGDGSELTTLIRAFKAHTSYNYTVVPDLKATLDILNSQATNLAAYNCMAYTYYVWDEEENIDIVPTDDPPYSGGPEVERGVVPNFLPLETQEVNADHFNLVDTAGWLLFVWPASNYATNEVSTSPYYEDRLYYQTWMGVKYVTTRADGSGFSGATDGAVMANYNCFQDQRLLGDLGIDYEYVDGGGYVRWTGSSE
jgi:hypothetical protein